MASDRQIEANRLNAQKCTGPRTPEGKAISSQNALKTGVDAQSEVIRCESRAEYEQLIAEFYRRFQPTEPEDRGLVDLLIKSVEASVWECGFNAVASKTLDRVFGLSADSFDRLDRRINSAQRNYQKALKQLFEIRERRAKEPAPPVPDAPFIADTPAIEDVPAIELAPEPMPETLSQPPAIASKPLNHELDSFLTFPNPDCPHPPAIAENADELPVEPDDPPIAA